MKHMKLLICMFILVAILSGCSQPMFETNPPKATLVIEIETASPIITNSPTKYYSSIEAATPSKSPISFPTLSHDQIQQEITKLLATNGNCTGICFWGFTPKETPFNHAIQGLTQLGGRFESDLGYIATYQIKESHIHIQLEVHGERDQPIGSIKARIMDLASPNLKGEEWLPFRPDTILAKFGNPQKIQFIIGGAPEGRASYEMVFLYHDMYIYYDGVQKLIAPSFIYHTCPTKPENIEQLDIFIGEYDQNNWKGDPEWNNYLVDIDELTDMTIEDFSKILRDPNQGCIDLDYEKYLSLTGK